MADTVFITPLDLALLTEVFEETCINNKMPKDSSTANSLAKALMAAYENGIQDKAGLRAVVSNGHQWAA
jgi:hypothetical protein